MPFLAFFRPVGPRGTSVNPLKREELIEITQCPRAFCARFCYFPSHHFARSNSREAGKPGLFLNTIVVHVEHGDNRPGISQTAGLPATANPGTQQLFA